MSNIVKKGASYILVGIVLFLTILALLGIWDVISFEDVIKKILLSLFIVFVSSVVVLFIFAVVARDNDNNKR
jgi:di/tricarboxylate transporter